MSFVHGQIYLGDDPSMDAMVNLDISHAWNERSSTNIPPIMIKQARLIMDQSTRQVAPYPPVTGANICKIEI